MDREGLFGFQDSGSEQRTVGDTEQIIPVVCNYNCGGRCPLKAHVRNGKLIRISTDETPDSDAYPQLRACLKGYANRSRIDHPDRLTYPMKRVGKRGEGHFKRISWDEAIDTIAQNLEKILSKYGPQSVYIQYGSGDRGAIAGRYCAERLMNLLGGYLDHYNSYSSACLNYTAPFITGESDTDGNDTMLHSKLIILNGFNPAETVFETNSCYWLAKAREAGIKIVVIDPVYTETAAAFADQWIAIKPGTDTALFAAMAYVIFTENLHDQAFLDKYCVGFDEAHMPEEVPPGNSFVSYLLGRSDGQAKTPQWAARITGVDAEVISALAVRYATAKPAQLIQGLGPQRHAYGESSVWAGIVLAAMTGNIGVPGGGWGGGISYRKNQLNYRYAIPIGKNPVKTRIPVFLWTDAVVRGTQMTAADGVKNGPLTQNIKFIWNIASNALVNQHADINKTVKILTDESLVEFIAASDQFLTPSARYADLVLPADHFFERCDIGYPWVGDRYIVLGSKAVEPPGECHHEYWWLSKVAEKLGIGEAFTEGKSGEDWIRQIIDNAQAENTGYPTWEELKKNGLYRQDGRNYVAFKKQIDDPENHPFKTPSEKIEIFSKTLYDMKNPEIPGVPRYMPAWEGPEDPLINKYPLQCIGSHTKRRVHSIYDESPWMEEAEPQVLRMNPADAQTRGIAEGDRVKVFNARGALMITAHLSKRVSPGVAVVPQGAWYTPDEDGVCQRGCINILTSQRPTPLAHGNAQHTVLVEVSKLD